MRNLLISPKRGKQGLTPGFQLELSPRRLILILSETLSLEQEPAGTLQWPLSRSRLGEEGSPEQKEPFRLGEDL